MDWNSMDRGAVAFLIGIAAVIFLPNGRFRGGSSSASSTHCGALAGNLCGCRNLTS